jgi:hypothetical protein
MQFWTMMDWSLDELGEILDSMEWRLGELDEILIYEVEPRRTG